MRTMFRLALAGLLAAIFATPAGAQAGAQASAQSELIGFDQVHQLFVAKQTRAAAQMMSVASADFRREFGRCRDAEMGARMAETEPRIDGLARKIASGGVGSVEVLTREFVQFDRLLAEHHQQLAAEGWSRPRFTARDVVAFDLGMAARYLERTGRWVRRPLDEEAQKAVQQALAVAKLLAENPENPPADTQAAIDGLGQVIHRQTITSGLR